LGVNFGVKSVVNSGLNWFRPFLTPKLTPNLILFLSDSFSHHT